MCMEGPAFPKDISSLKKKTEILVDCVHKNHIKCEHVTLFNNANNKIK